MAWELSQAILESLLSPRREGCSAWCPAVDVYRLADGWLLKFDVAGVSPADIEVSVSDRRVSVRGLRRDWIREQTGPCSAWSMEISYNQFERTVDLPVELSQAEIQTQYRDGMLVIRLVTGGTTA